MCYIFIVQQYIPTTSEFITWLCGFDSKWHRLSIAAGSIKGVTIWRYIFHTTHRYHSSVIQQFIHVNIDMKMYDVIRGLVLSHFKTPTSFVKEH